MAYVPKVSQFRDIIKQLSPPWLADGTAEKYLYIFGLGVDLLCEKLNEGMRARMPGQGTNTALPLLGDDRNLLQGPKEPNASFIPRLQGAIAENKLAGLPRALLDQIRFYIYPSTVTLRFVTPASTWDQIIAGVWSKFQGNNNWAWDGASNFNRGWVIVDSSSLSPWATDLTWADPGTWNDGGTWDTTATPTDVATILGLIRLWKGGATTVKNVIVTFDGSHFRPQYTADGVHNPNGFFGRQTTGDGTGATTIGTRFTSASYWSEVK